MRMYKIYKLTFPNNKVYIGMTSQKIKRRCRQGAYNGCPSVNLAIQKYGWDNIEINVLCEGLNKTDACKLEIESIKKYKSNNSNFGYNLDLGTKHSKEHVQKSISNRRTYEKENNPFYGKSWTEEQKNNQFKNRRSYKGFQNPNSKMIICRETNEIFNTLKETCEKQQISKPLLIGVLKGRYKQAKGFTYDYYEEIV